MAAGDRQSGTDAVGRGQQFGHDDNFPGASQGADPGRKQIGNDMGQINVGKGHPAREPEHSGQRFQLIIQRACPLHGADKNNRETGNEYREYRGAITSTKPK